MLTLFRSAETHNLYREQVLCGMNPPKINSKG